MNTFRKHWLWLFLGLTLAATVGYGWYALQAHNRLYRSIAASAAQTTATITRVYMEQRDEEQVPETHVEFAFQAQGKLHTGTYRVLEGYPQLVKGDTLKLWYHTQNPEMHLTDFLYHEQDWLGQPK